MNTSLNVPFQPPSEMSKNQGDEQVEVTISLELPSKVSQSRLLQGSDSFSTKLSNASAGRGKQDISESTKMVHLYLKYT